MPEPTIKPQSWQPSPLLRFSLGLHVGALLLLFLGAWKTALALILLNHVVLTAQGLWPRSTGLGPNLLRLEEATDYVALTLDDGPDPVLTPQVLDILDAYGAKASFFCIGQQAQAYPALVAQIVARGHRVENHSMAHPHHFSLMGPGTMMKEVGTAQAALAQCSGVAPAYFRAPAGLRNPFLDWVLHRQGLRLASWTRRGFDTREPNPQRVLDRLLKGLAPGDILLLHDRHSANTAYGQPVVLAVLPRLLDELQSRHLRCIPLPLSSER